ncbi:ParB/RepB/Spo0J family partition protein [Phenylobacterium sp. SCN 70-31]|uniref:ParB/RepB/Spo0J family partition protein n=1 Tax=Phenylobacterium sp. SCN 70-31 TaxID=1660129 RepID=UPI00086C09BC|nr:ParB/RepB/Spo0J family partition protein [Phenylobacterium sp. SCN 70-31]ODT83585.1 MAG: replication protein B [Phenylobacterium sp. SCN 70-31]
MSSKNRSFAAGLMGSLDEAAPQPEAPTRMPIGVLASRENRMAELASGAVVGRAIEQVDPARCRLWSEHNRDYAALDETRCADLIESFKAQGRQEVPAIVRRVRGAADIDFEVICGARRHWTVTWLRAHNYTDFRFLVEVRDLTDEEAFRISDLENRAREDLSDIERARDYLKALGRHYGGRQKDMAERLKVSEAWLSRYLDLARLPGDVVAAFEDPHELKIKHVTQLKPLLKPDDRERRVLAEATAIAKTKGEGAPLKPQDVIRRLVAAANAPKKSGSAQRSGKASAEVISSPTGQPLLRVEPRGKKEVQVTLLLQAGGSRADAERALTELLGRFWLQPSG